MARIGDTIPPRGKPPTHINDSLEDILGKAQQDDRNRLLEDIERLEKERDHLSEALRQQMEIVRDTLSADLHDARAESVKLRKSIEAAQKAFFAADNRALRKALGIGEGS